MPRFHNHPAYDGALANAVRQAADNPGQCFTVYFDGAAMYVRASGTAAPNNADIVCIAQRWDDRTVQLRFAGAHSEWRNV